MAFALYSFLLCGIGGVLTQSLNEVCNFEDSICPNGWIQFDHRCYFYHARERTFLDAESVCNVLGGHLVSIRSSFENDFVLDLLRNGGNDNVAWIGLHDKISDEDYIWTDGTIVRFTAFRLQPDVNGTCVQIFSIEGFWVDALCTAMAPFVCSQDINCGFKRDGGNGFSRGFGHRGSGGR
nr:snaclec CHH-B subunit beta-like [Syngnathus scovelli]